MITLRDSIEIKTTPERIKEWFRDIDKHYLDWHPDHVKCYWIGKPAEEGSILYFEEYLHGGLHKIKSVITKIVPNRKIEYKLLFPMSVICPKGSFLIEQKGENCIFTATLSYRFEWLFLRFAKDRVEAIKKHMREEGENLKRLLEK